MTAEAWPDDGVICAQTMAALYIIIGASMAVVGTRVLHRFLLVLLTTTRLRIFAFLMPWAGPISLIIHAMAVHYITHYGIVLNVSGAFKIRLWPRLVPPDCEAATKLLGESTVCLFDRFNAWIGLITQQPGGLGQMMSPLAMRPSLLGLGLLVFFWLSGCENVRDWNDAVRRDRIDKYVRWTRDGVWEWDDDGVYTRECRNLLRGKRSHQSVRWRRDGIWSWEEDEQQSGRESDQCPALV